MSAMLRLKELGWGRRRIARELGVSRNTVKSYIEAGGWRSYEQPARDKRLDGQETWLKQRFGRHRGNADVFRQELAPEKGIIVSLRTIERAVQPYRQELAAEARATVRLETAPGKQLHCTRQTSHLRPCNDLVQRKHRRTRSGWDRLRKLALGSVAVVGSARCICNRTQC